MNLIEISEREVIEAAKVVVADVAMGLYEQFAHSRDGRTLLKAVALLEERERAEQDTGTVPQPKSALSCIPEGPVDVPPRAGAAPIVRPPKKLSRKAQIIEDRRKSDVSGQAAGRDNIDYGTDELPSAR